MVADPPAVPQLLAGEEVEEASDSEGKDSSYEELVDEDIHKKYSV